MTFSINNNQQSAIMLSVIMMSVAFYLFIVMLSVIMLSVIGLSAVAPCKRFVNSVKEIFILLLNSKRSLTCLLYVLRRAQGSVL